MSAERLARLKMVSLHWARARAAVLRRLTPGSARRLLQGAHVVMALGLLGQTATSVARMTPADAAPIRDTSQDAGAAAAARIQADLRDLSQIDPFFGRASAIRDFAAEGFVLTATRPHPNSRAASAIVRSKDGREASYAVGDVLPGGPRLAEVAAHHVVLTQGEAEGILAFADWLQSKSTAAVAAIEAPEPNIAALNESSLARLASGEVARSPSGRVLLSRPVSRKAKGVNASTRS